MSEKKPSPAAANDADVVSPAKPRDSANTGKTKIKQDDDFTAEEKENSF